MTHRTRRSQRFKCQLSPTVSKGEQYLIWRIIHCTQFEDRQQRVCMRPFKNKELCTHASPFAMSFNHTLIQAGPHEFHFQPHMKQQLHTTAHNDLCQSGRYFRTAAYQFLHRVEGNKSMMIHDEDWQSERRKSLCFIFSLSTLHSKLVHMALLDMNYLLIYIMMEQRLLDILQGLWCVALKWLDAFSLGPVTHNLHLLNCTCTVLSSFFFFGIPVDHKFLNNNNSNIC